MFTVRKGKGKVYNQQSGKPGELSKSGRIFRNNLLDADLTSQKIVRRKLQ